jgi:hypothetical protein
MEASTSLPPQRLRPFDLRSQKQDVHAGARAAVPAAVLCSFLLPSLREGKIKNLLFMARGACCPPPVQQRNRFPASRNSSAPLSNQKASSLHDEALFQYLNAFLVGGAICLVGQLLIDYTSRLPPASSTRSSRRASS